jgi:hypothetical protein
MCLAVNTKGMDRIGSNLQAATFMQTLYKIIARSASSRLRHTYQELADTRTELFALKINAENFQENDYECLSTLPS